MSSEERMTREEFDAWATKFVESQTSHALLFIKSWDNDGLWRLSKKADLMKALANSMNRLENKVQCYAALQEATQLILAVQAAHTRGVPLAHDVEEIQVSLAEARDAINEVCRAMEEYNG